MLKYFILRYVGLITFITVDMFRQKTRVEVLRRNSALREILRGDTELGHMFLRLFLDCETRNSLSLILTS